MTTIQAVDLLKGLEQSLDDYCELNDEGKTAFRMGITALELFGNSEQLPSAQPKIIRCKDCRYAKMTHTGECKYCTYLADNFGIDDAVYFEGNDYCSHAERRTDESNVRDK